MPCSRPESNFWPPERLTTISFEWSISIGSCNVHHQRFLRSFRSYAHCGWECREARGPAPGTRSRLVLFGTIPNTAGGGAAGLLRTPPRGTHTPPDGLLPSAFLRIRSKLSLFSLIIFWRVTFAPIFLQFFSKASPRMTFSFSFLEFIHDLSLIFLREGT